MLTTPEQIDAMRLLTLRQMLKLEIAGLRRSGRSAYSIIKSETGLKGSRESVLAALDQWRNELLGK